jgi:hypothetical protein
MTLMFVFGRALALEAPAFTYPRAKEPESGQVKLRSAMFVDQRTPEPTSE